MFTEEVDVICNACDSEFTITQHNSDETLKYCCFCGNNLELEEEE